MRLQNKVAIVTGAASGIGEASAFLFAKEGAKVILADIDEQRGEAAKIEIEKRGGKAFFVKTDVSKSKDVENLIHIATEKYGRLDVLFNNAGTGFVGTVVEASEELWDKIIDINLKGVFLGMKYAIPHMIKQGGGSIINTSSVGGLVGDRGYASYDASKGGVILLTKATALDFGPYNIRVNSICPGTTDTPFFRSIKATGNPEEYLRINIEKNAALKRLIKPEEVANVALFLASDESSAVTGTAIPVDAGYTAI
jgi:NAD(P)-dependent dehydrogenase (short-subunit alcohol dehydrogenase family)